MTDPRLDELLDGASPDEHERLAAVHERLVAAGAPPELPPTLAAPPEPPTAQVIPLGRRRYTLVAAGLTAAAALFLVGYAIGQSRDRVTPEFTLAMAGEGATATLDVLPVDDAGNWPMTLRVNGLAELPDGQWYELWLTRDGERIESCGTFVVGSGETSVSLNAPYRLKAFTGWVVTRSSDDATVIRTQTV